MKSVLIAGGCGIAAFVAMMIYMGMDSTKNDDSVPLVTELPPAPKPKPDDDEPAQPKKSTASPKQSTQRPKRQAARSQGNRPAPPRKTLYFRAVYGNNPIPSRVIIYNTQIGDLTILLIGTQNSTGEFFHSSGVKDKHVWDVFVEDGYVSVYWDGKPVPPG